MGGHDLSPEAVKKHVKTYIFVLLTLLILTAVTVGVSTFHLPIAQAVLVAMVIASAKATLVALYFMHLSNEKKIIYGTLALTGFFFLFLLSIGFYFM